MSVYHDSPYGAHHPASSLYHPSMPFQRQQQQQPSPYAHFSQQQQRGYGRQSLHQQQPSMHQSVYPDSRPQRSDEGRAHLDRLFSGLVNPSLSGSGPATPARHEYADVSGRHMPYSPTDARARHAQNEQYYHSAQALPVGTAHGFECLPGSAGYGSHAQYAAPAFSSEHAGYPHHRVSPTAAGIGWENAAAFPPQAHAWNPIAGPQVGRGYAHGEVPYSHHPSAQASSRLPVLAPPFQHVNNAVWQASILPPMQLALPPPVGYQPAYEPEDASRNGRPVGFNNSEADYQEPGPTDGMMASFYSDDDDHPSYNKPPHSHYADAAAQAAAVRASAANHHYADGPSDMAAEGPVHPPQQQQQQQQETIEEPQVIDAGASAIPPPPAIEDSAHPLAALATDLVWEAFLAAANCTSPAFGSLSQFPNSKKSNATHDELSSSPTSFPSLAHQSRSPVVHASDRSRSTSAVPEGGQGGGNGFGAIGGERRPRNGSNEHQRHSSTSPASDASSSASSDPGTPHSTSAPAPNWGMSSAEMSSGRLSGGGNYWNHQVLSPAIAKVSAHQQHSSRVSPLYAQHGSQLGQAPFNLAPPHALYEQVQKLLGATLLSQQVLLLALYFIAKLPQTSPLYPPATSQSALKSTSAPFKLLLAALVVANKHLDDNSFRNSTFAAVSGITLPEVNALEYSLLAGLSFDINVNTDTWLTWLQDLENQSTTRFTREHVHVSSIVAPLICKVVQERRAFDLKQQQQQQIQLEQQQLADLQREQQDPLSYSISSAASSKASMDMPMTPISPPPRSESSWSSVFEMDAAVPIEQRPKYKKAFSHQPETAAPSALSSSWTKTNSFGSSTAVAPTSAHKVGREAYGAEYRRCSDWPPATYYGYNGGSGNLVAA